MDYGELRIDPPNPNTQKLLRDMCRLIDNHIFPWEEYGLQQDELEDHLLYPSHLDSWQPFTRMFWNNPNLKKHVGAVKAHL